MRHPPRTTLVGGMVAAIAASAFASCGGRDAGVGRLTVNGQVEVSSTHVKVHLAANGDTLRVGDQVHIVSGGGAVRLVPSGLVQMMAGSILTIDKTLRLTKGAVLIQPGTSAIRVAVQNATLVVPSGAAQLTMGSALEGLTAKVYQDRSSLEIPGNPSTLIAAPRQARLTPAVQLPLQARPIDYQESDAWDHQYLAPAVALSKQLAAAAAGFDAQLAPDQGTDATFYQNLLPSLAGRSEFTSVFTAQRKVAKPGDYLIATVIALRGTHETFAARLNEELDFFGQGAPWGFVAHDQGVTDLNGVLNDVLAAILRAQLPLTGTASASISAGPGAPAPSAATSPPTTTTAPPRSNRSQTATTPSGGAGPPLVQLPTPNPLPPVAPIPNPLLDPLIALLNSILGGGKH